MSEGNGDGRALRLSDARRRTPPVDPAEALRNDLRMAFLKRMGTDGVEALADKLKEQALAGDHKAMQLLMQLLVAPQPPARVGPVIVNPPGRRKNVEAIPVDGQMVSRDEVPPLLREDCARLIKFEGPLTAEVLGERCGVTAYVVATTLTDDGWFEEENGKWALSGEGWAAVNRMRDD